MIKTSAIFSAHAIHVLLRNTLIFFVVLFVALFAWLAIGVQIKTLKVFDYHVDGLYIKLNKKLILKANKISLPQSKANPAFKRVDETFQSIKYLLTFFNYIELKEIDFSNNTMAVIYHDNILQLSSKDYLIRGNIEQDEDVLKGTIPILYLKKQDVTLRGTFEYSLKDHILQTKGDFAFHHFIGTFSASKIQKDITFSLKSDTFSDLKSIIEKFELAPDIKSWIVDKVTAKSYKVMDLKGKGKVEDRGFHLDVSSLKARALLNDVEIQFQEKLDPVKAKRVVLKYEDNSLYFDLYQPLYREKNLDGSKVSITNLTQNDTTLILNIKANHTPFDKQVQEILEAYDVQVPFSQKEGTSEAIVDMYIALKKDQTDIKASIDMNESDVYFGESKIHILGASLAYEDKHVTIKNIKIVEKEYRGNIKGLIDIEKKNAELVFDAKKIQFKSEGSVVWQLKDVALPFTLNYQKALKISIPKLGIDIDEKEEETIFTVSDLSAIKKYMTNTSLIDKGGNFTLRTKDFKTYTFKGLLKRNSCFLYKNKETCKTHIPITGTLTAKGLNFYAFGKHIHYNQSKSRIDIKNINIDLKKFLKITSKGTPTKSSKKFVIVGTNSNLRYGPYKLIMDSYDVEVDKRGNIRTLGSSKGDIIKFSKVNDVITMQALRIKDEVLHPLINFHGLQGGRYSIKIVGDPAKTMKGQILIEGGVMKDFKAYTSTSKFVNDLPELDTLHDSKNLKDGFRIEEGVIEYRMIKSDKIVFDSIYIKGATATLVGSGELNLINKTMNIHLTIQVAKELGKIVGSIPLVGYILLGKDKSINIGLNITGSIDKLKVKTSAVKDILSTPIELIKRTLESPTHIINK